MVESAKEIVKTIVDELHTSKYARFLLLLLLFNQGTDKPPTYPPSQVGGMAGGHKYIVGEIFIKFPIDNLGLYGGDDIVAAKTVSISVSNDYVSN